MRLEMKLVRDDGTVVAVHAHHLNVPTSPTDEVGVDFGHNPIIDERTPHLALARMVTKFTWLDISPKTRRM